jgi:ferredoxin-like protein FixX
MRKQPRSESKGRKSASSNKQKRAALELKRTTRKRNETRKSPDQRAERAIPLGAVAADLAQQVPNNSYSSKPLFYVDQPFDCVDCGTHEVWTASQQKWYYEVAKGSLYGRAVRCRACRQRRRRPGNNPD